ncbi:MAG: cytochrome P460 family protein [Campylobacteraceae bacterium]|nr:cytochrome P460 family protein [Campylobacteraceae bacterium]
MKKVLLSLACGLLILTSSALADSMQKDRDKMMKMNSVEKMNKMKKGFGTKEDIIYAKYLWKKLETSTLNSTPATLYLGGPPHGKVREVLEGTIDNQRVIVKRNYGGKNITINKVKNNRSKYLKAITVMIQRKNYDSKNNDWFWIKYKANGTLHTTPNKTELAGKVKGCISCHSSASGNDLVFIHNKDANAEITLVNEMMK